MIYYAPPFFLSYNILEIKNVEKNLGAHTFGHSVDYTFSRDILYFTSINRYNSRLWPLFQKVQKLLVAIKRCFLKKLLSSITILQLRWKSLQCTKKSVHLKYIEKSTLRRCQLCAGEMQKMYNLVQTYVK